jgi:uncharacterized phage protein (TIGR02216 family)
VKKIAWSSLMKLGLVELRLAPDVFWSLTPAELMFIAGGGAAREALTRAGLAEMLEKFPDRAATSAME